MGIKLKVKGEWTVELTEEQSIHFLKQYGSENPQLAEDYIWPMVLDMDHWGRGEKVNLKEFSIVEDVIDEPFCMSRRQQEVQFNAPTMYITGQKPSVLRLSWDESDFNVCETREQFKQRITEQINMIARFNGYEVKKVREHNGHGYVLVIILLRKDAKKDWNFEDDF